MITYKLLTPGPLTTTETVKKKCWWTTVPGMTITNRLPSLFAKTLLKLAHVSPEEYTAVLMQGSGTFGVESVLTSAVSAQDKLLIIANGAYGQRMAEIAHRAGLSHQLYNCSYDETPDSNKIAETSPSIRRLPTYPWYIAKLLPVFSTTLPPSPKS